MDTYQSALATALKKLSAADKFEAEIRASLAEHSQANVDCVIDTLKQRRILDDRKTTQNLIERRSGRRAVGDEKLRAELIARGAPEEIVDECLANLGGADEAQRMRDALAAKFKPTDDRVKGARFLLSRGFAEDGIEGALDDFFRSD
jgi:SOS response regulatory protein OraA/RecX